MRLASVSDIKLYLGKQDDNNDDQLLDLILQQVSARIELALNRQLTKTSRTQVFDGGNRYYFLPAYPIEVSNPAPVVTVSGTPMTLNSDYYIWSEQGTVEFYTIPAGPNTPSYPNRDWRGYRPQNVSITWTGGYVLNPITGVLAVPDALKRATMLQTAFEYKRRKELGLKSVSMPDGSVDVIAPTKFLSDVADIVAMYRRGNL